MKSSPRVLLSFALSLLSSPHASSNRRRLNRKQPPLPQTSGDIARDTDGSVTIQFGGCDGKVSNCLPITAGWNHMVRLYRPRPEILKGKWKFPDAQPVQ